MKYFKMYRTVIIAATIALQVSLIMSKSKAQVGWIYGTGKITTTDKVGIGTSYPMTKLHVIGSIRVGSETVINSSGQWVGSPTGLVGPQGPIGLIGPAGATGATGAQGPIGLTGADGATGLQGDPGTSSWTDGTGKVTTTVEVGIGTEIPTYDLHVAGNGGAKVALDNYLDGVKLMLQAGSIATYIGNWSNHDLVFQTNMNERLRITNTGKVGIGTASPGQLLDVQGAAQFGTGNVNLITSAGKIAAINSTTFNAVGGYWDLDEFVVSSPDIFFEAATARVIIETGKVGIGTANPQSKLHLSGSGDINGIKFGEAGDVNLYYAYGSLQTDNNFNILSQAGIGTDNDGYSRLNVNSGNFIHYGININLNSVKSTGSRYGLYIDTPDAEGLATTYGAYIRGITNEESGSQTVYGLKAVAQDGGGGVSSTLYSIYTRASGGAINYAIYSDGGINYFSGNVGIGTLPHSNFVLDIGGSTHIGGNLYFSGGSDHIIGIWDHDTNGDGNSILLHGGDARGSSLAFGGNIVLKGGEGIYDGEHGNVLLAYDVANEEVIGKVGIGTTNPGEMLSVKGKIEAEEVMVITDVMPDYVFKDDYKLLSLVKLEQFIKENNHLPEVPSEKEVEENGGTISLGEMNTILLKKIEELTLYTIEQQNQINNMKREIEELRETGK
ncbi:collagen-like protein [Bacteroidota bacterium]